MPDIADRFLNPGVILTMALAGLAYGRILWSLNLRPTGVLWVASTAPGAIFMVTTWAIRALQGTPSFVWPALLFDWMVFATVGFLAVVVARRRHR